MLSSDVPGCVIGGAREDEDVGGPWGCPVALLDRLDATPGSAGLLLRGCAQSSRWRPSRIRISVARALEE